MPAHLPIGIADVRLVRIDALAEVLDDAIALLDAPRGERPLALDLRRANDEREIAGAGDSGHVSIVWAVMCTAVIAG